MSDENERFTITGFGLTVTRADGRHFFHMEPQVWSDVSYEGVLKMEDQLNKTHARMIRELGGFTGSEEADTKEASPVIKRR